MPNTSVNLVVARVTNPSIPSHSGEGSEHIPVFVIPLWPGLRAAMLPLKVGKAYHFDTHGDLTLKVGGNRSAYHFLVCSRTLRLSSPVFEAMLFRGSAESKPADSAAWTIQLPDDDPSVILLVLSIIHGHFQLVTRELEEYQLHEVLVATEKYDMTKILNPWASTCLLDFLAMTIDLPEEHKECNPLPALKDEMQKLVDCVSAPITDAHILYLDNQAKKTGI
ncbi:hypothetical protein K4K61_009998 [Colletotrichum sp. SAR11_59]|nr:hypothetical protein K4K61_009998 [Colletotrichum sp. SAR11_59]